MSVYAKNKVNLPQMEILKFLIYSLPGLIPIEESLNNNCALKHELCLMLYVLVSEYFDVKFFMSCMYFQDIVVNNIFAVQLVDKNLPR